MSVDDVAVAPWAHVAARIFRLAAHRTDRPPRLHQRLRALHERGRLRAGDREACRRRLLALLLDDGLRDHDDALPLLVPAQAQRGHRPGRLHRLHQVEALRRRLRRRRQLVEHLPQVRRQRAHLLLLALDGHQPAPLTSLDIEDALALRPHRPGREVIGRIEVERAAHRFTSDERSPSIAFIVSTLRPSGRYAIAVIDAGAITMRWKRSSGVPSAWATSVLIGSACEATTMVWPRWRSTRRPSVLAMRACISTNDSPPGKRNALACRWTTAHSGRRAARLIDSPVHAPTSTSSRPRSTRTARPRAFASGATVSRARSSSCRGGPLRGISRTASRCTTTPAVPTASITASPMPPSG